MGTGYAARRVSCRAIGMCQDSRETIITIFFPTVFFSQERLPLQFFSGEGPAHVDSDLSHQVVSSSSTSDSIRGNFVVSHGLLYHLVCGEGRGHIT